MSKENQIGQQLNKVYTKCITVKHEIPFKQDLSIRKIILEN